MKEPISSDEILKLHKLRRSDPQRYIRISSDWIGNNPNNADAYFGRHVAWMNIGEPMRAMADLDRVIELAPDPVAYRSRGDVHRHLGEYGKALADYAAGEALNPDQWQTIGFGLLNQADCHARLGDASAALACCARLPEGFWTPGIHGAPAGGKAEIASALRRIATAATHGPS